MSNINNIMNYLADNLDVTSDITQQEEAELLEKLAPLGSVDIKEKIREVLADEMPKWRYVGQATGETLLALPQDSNWNEVYIRVYFGLNPIWTVTFYALRQELPNGTSDTGSGYLGGEGAGNQHSVDLRLSKLYAQLALWKYGTTDATSSSYIKVYVR